MTRRNPTGGQLRIPDVIAERLLAVQPRVREISAQAREWGLLKRLLNFREAIVERQLPLTRELAFWEIEPDEDLEKFLFYRLGRALPSHQKDVDWRSLPAGYRPLVVVLEFELARQFGGWVAVGNAGTRGMKRILAAYRDLALISEADALEAVTATYSALPRNADEAIDAMESRYAQVGSTTPEFEDRVAAMLAFVRASPGKFGVAM
jgi:hypothetical protein